MVPCLSYFLGTYGLTCRFWYRHDGVGRTASGSRMDALSTFLPLSSQDTSQTEQRGEARVALGRTHGLEEQILQERDEGHGEVRRRADREKRQHRKRDERNVAE